VRGEGRDDEAGVEGEGALDDGVAGDGKVDEDKALDGGPAAEDLAAEVITLLRNGGSDKKDGEATAACCAGMTTPSLPMFRMFSPRMRVNGYASPYRLVRDGTDKAATPRTASSGFSQMKELA
jgi:hypothetical protein